MTNQICRGVGAADLTLPSARSRTLSWVVFAVFLEFTAAVAVTQGPAAAAADVEFDVTSEDGASSWAGRHDIGRVSGSPEGLRIEITGADPYLHGPARDYPPGVPLLLEMRLRSETGGMAQVFYFRRGPQESQSVRFAVPGGRSFDAIVALPPLGADYRLRFDPPGTNGTCTIERLRIVPRRSAAPDAWLAPERLPRREDDLHLTSESLKLRHAANQWSAFELTWGDHSVATSHSRPLIGILVNDHVRWISLADRARVVGEQVEGRIVMRAELASDEPASEKSASDKLPRLRFTQTFSGLPDQAIDVVTTVEADAPCDLIHVPTLILLPGFGTHGERKSQALFAGVEYLSDEPSRSTADLEGPAAQRLVPASHKITFPLMAVQHGDHFVSLQWEPSENTAALFDSPDRTLGGGAHVLGLLAPGASAAYRADGELVAYRPVRVTPAKPLRQQATIVVGKGTSVSEAVRDYVVRRGLPAVPRTPTLDAYVRLASAGWLDSSLRDGDRYRHAVGNAFAPQPALDAAWMLGWLSSLTTEPALRERLQAAARGAAAAVPSGHEYHSHVGHLKHPVAGMTLAAFESTVAQARATARGQLAAFPADGIVRYQPPRDGIDYSRTQPSREASGFAALPVAVMLEAAAYAGDRELLASGLAQLAKLDRYDGDVPRGAQTWEIPLHTPDIMASAHLVRAYSIAFRLTGDRRWLERARYWAWTGVPFVYLRPPAEGEVGPYATIAVLGATQWQQPVWIGLPVQWCGLVYADGLRWLEPHDPTGPWKRLADGITASGIAQTYPLGHPRQGLLPDSFDLLAQQRNPADINPGTLQPLALRLLTGRPSYSLLAWPKSQVWAYGPGQLEVIDSTDRGIAFRFVPWGVERSTVAVHGLRRTPRVTVNGTMMEPGDEQRYLAAQGTLILTFVGQEPVRIAVDGLDANPPSPEFPSK